MSTRDCEDFFTIAGQYYVAGRYAAFAGFMPVAGNLLHHAVEMYLKGGLSNKGYSRDVLKNDLGHKLPKIWTEFKMTYNGPALKKFNRVTSSLHLFEGIRYPGKALDRGMRAMMNTIRHAPLSSPQVTVPKPKEPKIELCLPDIDELVDQLFTTVGLEPTQFLSSRMVRQEARKYLRKHNTVRRLTR
jgi:hypothetical protein